MKYGHVRTVRANAAPSSTSAFCNEITLGDLFVVCLIDLRLKVSTSICSGPGSPRISSDSIAVISPLRVKAYSKSC